MDLSGIGINKAFSTNLPSAAPYFYISASLDLSGLPLGTYYFNLDNDLTYGSARDYSKFITIDDNLVISEVVVYSDSDIVSVGDVSLLIGGSKGPVGYNPIVVPWAAKPANPVAVPPAWSWSYLTPSQVNSGSINYFGHEGGHCPYYYRVDGVLDYSNKYKYLTLQITNQDPNSNTLPSDVRGGLIRGLLPTGNPVIVEGRLCVVLKVYPKFQ